MWWVSEPWRLFARCLVLDCVPAWVRRIRIEGCDNETPCFVSVSRKTIADLKQGWKGLDINSNLFQVKVGVSRALTSLANGQDARIQDGIVSKSTGECSIVATNATDSLIKAGSQS